MSKEFMLTLFMKEGNSSHVTVGVDGGWADDAVEQWQRETADEIRVRGIKGEYLAIRKDTLCGILVVDIERAMQDDDKPNKSGRVPEIHGKLH